MKEIFNIHVNFNKIVYNISIKIKFGQFGEAQKLGLN